MAEKRERFQRLERYFAELEGLSGGLREARLEELERQEPGLFPELRELLDDPDSGVARGIEGISAQASRQLEGAAAEALPRIDRYRPIRRLGAGGMGEVWEAEQEEPVRRRVALKLLLAGAGAAARAARFEAERQALATMDHPNIARVFDGGATADGAPYFVMELVEDGVPITRYCRREQLSLDDRIRLILEVCDAIEHAHRKRIIHRDLKPSNVLVTPGASAKHSSASPASSVKVIDFGIAKPLEADWALATHATVVGELVGTPEYMSPEQAALGAVDIDTRSDVYTLGLLLFEVITGRLPVASQELRSLPFDELCRRIREEEAPSPSTLLRRASRASGAPTDSSASGEIASIGTTWRRVAGDLDRIVAKALAKDRERRYGSAAELAEDLRRFLEHEPVRATAPSRRYRLAKFVRRNRIAVFSTAFLVMGLSVGLVAALVGFQRARVAQAEASASADEARESLAAMRSGEQFLFRLFEGASPMENPGQDLSAAELLDRGVDQIDELDAEPRVQGRLLNRIAEVYRLRGDYTKAESLLLDALGRFEQLEPEPATPIGVELAEVLGRLGAVYRFQSRTDEAAVQFDRALTMYEGVDPPPTDAIRTRSELAQLNRQMGQYAEANSLYDRLLVEYERAGAGEVPTAILRFNYATSLGDGGDPGAAIDQIVLAQAVMRSRQPPDHPNFGTIHANLSVYTGRLGLVACSLEHAREANRIDLLALPANHPDIANSFNQLGNLARRLGSYSEAEDYFDRALEILDVEDVKLLRGAVLANSGHLSIERGEAMQGVESLRTALVLDRAQEQHAQRRRNMASTWFSVAVGLRVAALDTPDARDSRLEEAERALEEALAMDGENEAKSIERGVAFQRALIAAQRGQLDSARAFFAELGSPDEDGYPIDDLRTLQFRAQLPALLGDADLAFAYARAAIAHRSRSRWILEAPELKALAEESGFAELEAALNEALGSDGECPGAPVRGS